MKKLSIREFAFSLVATFNEFFSDRQKRVGKKNIYAN